MKKLSLLAAAALFSTSTLAADYLIDTKGAHASVLFETSHLGFSVLSGRFNDFSGSFSWDASAPEKSKISVVVNTASVDSNHDRRDKHLRTDDFLNVDKYPEARFESTQVTPKGDQLEVQGNFTLHGTTKPVTFMATKVGEGDDPWGGYRAGFSGTLSIVGTEYGMKSGGQVDLTFHIEGIKQ